MKGINFGFFVLTIFFFLIVLCPFSFAESCITNLDCTVTNPCETVTCPQASHVCKYEKNSQTICPDGVSYCANYTENDILRAKCVYNPCANTSEYIGCSVTSFNCGKGNDNSRVIFPVNLKPFNSCCKIDKCEPKLGGKCSGNGCKNVTTSTSSCTDILPTCTVSTDTSVFEFFSYLQCNDNGMSNLKGFDFADVNKLALDGVTTIIKGNMKEEDIQVDDEDKNFCDPWISKNDGYLGGYYTPNGSGVELGRGPIAVLSLHADKFWYDDGFIYTLNDRIIMGSFSVPGKIELGSRFTPSDGNTFKSLFNGKNKMFPGETGEICSKGSFCQYPPHENYWPEPGVMNAIIVLTDSALKEAVKPDSNIFRVYALGDNNPGTDCRMLDFTLKYNRFNNLNNCGCEGNYSFISTIYNNGKGISSDISYINSVNYDESQTMCENITCGGGVFNKDTTTTIPVTYDLPDVCEYLDEHDKPCNPTKPTSEVCDWKFYYENGSAWTPTLSKPLPPDPECWYSAEKQTANINTFHVSLTSKDITADDPFGPGKLTGNELCADSKQLFKDSGITKNNDNSFLFNLKSSESSGFVCNDTKSVGKPWTAPGFGNCASKKTEIDCKTEQTKNTLAVYCCKTVSNFQGECTQHCESAGNQTISQINRCCGDDSLDDPDDSELFCTKCPVGNLGLNLPPAVNRESREWNSGSLNNNCCGDDGSFSQPSADNQDDCGFIAGDKLCYMDSSFRNPLLFNDNYVTSGLITYLGCSNIEVLSKEGEGYYGCGASVDINHITGLKDFSSSPPILNIDNHDFFCFNNTNSSGESAGKGSIAECNYDGTPLNNNPVVRLNKTSIVGGIYPILGQHVPYPANIPQSQLYVDALTDSNKGIYYCTNQYNYAVQNEPPSAKFSRDLDLYLVDRSGENCKAAKNISDNSKSANLRWTGSYCCGEFDDSVYASGIPGKIHNESYNERQGELISSTYPIISAGACFEGVYQPNEYNTVLPVDKNRPDGVTKNSFKKYNYGFVTLSPSKLATNNIVDSDVIDVLSANKKMHELTEVYVMKGNMSGCAIKDGALAGGYSQPINFDSTRAVNKPYNGSLFGFISNDFLLDNYNDRPNPGSSSENNGVLIDNLPYCSQVGPSGIYDPSNPLSNTEEYRRYYCSYREIWNMSNFDPTTFGDMQKYDKTHLSYINWSKEDGFSLTPNNVQEAECCSPTQCWNETRCIGSQHSSPFIFPHNHSINDEGDGYRCVWGEWYWSSRKYTWDRSAFGYCERESQCLVYPYTDDLDSHYVNNGRPELFISDLENENNPICINDTQYIGDHYCEQGNWTSRTKLIAMQLIDSAEGGDDYTVFCDSYKNVLNYLNYTPGFSFISPMSNDDLNLGTGFFEGLESANECFDAAAELFDAGVMSKGCANNVCVLVDSQKIGIGVSINQPIDSESYNILELFGISQEDALDYCSNALTPLSSSNKYSWTECSGDNNPVSGSSVFYDDSLMSVIYYKNTASSPDGDFNYYDYFFGEEGLWTLYITPMIESLMGNAFGNFFDVHFLFNRMDKDLNQFYVSKGGGKFIIGYVEKTKNDWIDGEALSKRYLVVKFIGFNMDSNNNLCDSIKEKNFHCEITGTNEYTAITPINEDAAMKSWIDLTARLRLNENPGVNGD